MDLYDRKIDPAVRFEECLKKIKDIDLRIQLQIAVNDVISQAENLWRTVYGK